MNQAPQLTASVDIGRVLPAGLGDQEATPRLDVLEHRQRKMDEALTAIHRFVIGDLPLELYEPEHQDEIHSHSAHLGKQACFPVSMGPVELRRAIHDAGFHWARTRWDSDTGDYPMSERLSIEGRRAHFLSGIRDSLPFSHRLRGDMAENVDYYMDVFHSYGSSDVGHRGSLHGFDTLLEDHMRISFLIPEEKGHGSLPFESLRDFVHSLLPTSIPMVRPTLRYKSTSTRPTHAMAQATREDPDVVLRLISGLGRQFSALHEILSRSHPLETFEDRSFYAFAEKKDWPDGVRELRSVRARVEHAAPGSIVRIAHSDPERKLMHALDSIPPFNKGELDAWAQANGFSPEEIDVLYDYLMGVPPSKISALEALMEKLFITGGALHDPSVSFRCKPILISERGKTMDDWTAKLITKIKTVEREADQTLLLEADTHAHSILNRIRGFSDRRADILIGSPDFYRWSESCEKLAQNIDPRESYDAFVVLIEEIWGDLGAFRAYMNSLVEAKRQKTLSSPEKDPRFIALLAIQRGWIECMFRLLKSGIPEDETVKTSTQVLADLQRFLALHVGKTGFPFDKDYIKWLVYSNDPLLLALTEGDYYATDTHALGLHLGRHMRAVGSESQHNTLAPRIHDNPVGLYASAKLAYLKGDYSACLLFVETVVRPSKDSSYFDDFLHGLMDADATKEPDQSELRKDRTGLKGYAPIRTRENLLVKELVRIGLLCISKLPPAEGEEAERRHSLEKMFKSLQGELMPVQLMNLYLDEAQKARDATDFERADYNIERAWQAIGDLNGPHARRIEHNEAEIKDVRLSHAREPSDREKHQITGEILVMERNLHLEERRFEQAQAVRVWEYDASYLQALIRFAGNQLPGTGLPTVERRHKVPFAFEEFEGRPMADWISESSQLARASLRVLATTALKNALWAGEQILKWLKDNLPLTGDPEIQKLPLLAEWEALVNELKEMKS